MITFICSIVLLIGGYFIYGTFVEKQFGADGNRKTPAYESEDGVDYVPMSWSKIFLIQFLNIAGLGPIFGAVLGAVYGPSAFIWIVLGIIVYFLYSKKHSKLQNGGFGETFKAEQQPLEDIEIDIDNKEPDTKD